MSTLPTFILSCIAADNTGNPVLFGVASGRLEAHAIDLTNALAPTSKLISATSTPSGWDAQSSLGCYSYAGSAPSPSNPISILQFGATNNLQANFFPNGTWANAVETATASTLNYQSPKLFSLVGSTDSWNWFVARATPKAGGATSWKGVRAGARIDAGPQEYVLLSQQMSVYFQGRTILQCITPDPSLAPVRFISTVTSIALINLSLIFVHSTH